MRERVKTAISNAEACHEGEVMMEHKREETNEKQTENVIVTERTSSASHAKGRKGRFYRCRPRRE